MVKKYVCIPSSFLVINICNQGKTLCSPCISRFWLPLKINVLYIYTHYISTWPKNQPRGIGQCNSVRKINLSLSLSLSHTHTHTHTEREREREREREHPVFLQQMWHYLCLVNCFEKWHMHVNLWVTKPRQWCCVLWPNSSYIHVYKKTKACTL